MKLASTAGMGGSATRPVVATPEPAERAVARDITGAQPMCRSRRGGNAAGIQIHRGEAATANSTGNVSTRTTNSRKKPYSDRLPRRPLLAALLSSQQAA